MRGIDRAQLNDIVAMSSEVTRGRVERCERLLMALHSLFLTPGEHTVLVCSLQEGRWLVTTLLESLSCYSRVSCLTLERADALPDWVTDVYQELGFSGGIFAIDMLERYLLEEFYSDFLWVEASGPLEQSAWFLHFIQQMRCLGFVRHVPIVVVREHCF